MLQTEQQRVFQIKDAACFVAAIIRGSSARAAAEYTELGVNVESLRRRRRRSRRQRCIALAAPDEPARAHFLVRALLGVPVCRAAKAVLESIVPELEEASRGGGAGGVGRAVLRADALRFLTTFRARLPKALVVQALPAVVELLAAEENVVVFV